MSHPHTCDVLVLTCIDYRFQGAVHDFLNRQGLRNDYDLICLAGAAKKFIEPVTGAGLEMLFEELKISVDLHKIKEFWIIDHEDCGAYGGSTAFESREEEKRRHEENLEKARGLVLERFPNLKVKTFYAQFREPSIEVESVLQRIKQASSKI